MSPARIAQGIERTLDALLGLGVAVMVLAMIWQVVGRYVFSRAPGWSEELARFLMLWITMLGSAAALRGGGHLAVTSFVDSLRPRARAGVLMLRDAVMLGAAGVLLWWGAGFAQMNGVQESAAMEIPMTIPYGALPLGGALLIVMLALSRLLGGGFATQSSAEDAAF